MSLFKKWFCLHVWKSYMCSHDCRTSNTIEYIICQKCGKIQKLEY